MMSLFGSLFSKKQKEPEYPEVVDFSSIHTDIHSHLIPGIDDGVKTIEESLEMIRGFSALGYKKLYTTPHIMSDFFKNTQEIINEGLEVVRAAIRQEGIPIELHAAAEYYLDEMFLQKLYDKQLMTIGEKHVLFEISYINPPDNLFNVIFELIIHGYKPILAHPERYPFYYEKFDEYTRLKESGVLLQLNINSLSGYYGLGAKKTAEKMIDANLIDLIGSDLHGQRHLDCLQRVIHEKYFRKLVAIGVGNSAL
jgi:protein-tyrosine phosphatase